MVLATILYLWFLDNLFLLKNPPNPNKTQNQTPKPTKNVLTVKTKLNALVIHFTLLL